MSETEKKKLLNKLYNEDGRSWAEIAELLDTYSNKVRRDAKKLGLQSRSRSEAQKVALQTGRHEHPTKGRGHSEEAKIRISDGTANMWKSLTAEEIENRRQKAKENWNKKSPEEIRTMTQRAMEGVRKAAKVGSTLEKHLLQALISNGYKVEFHKEQWVVREKLQIDLFLPELNVAIEVDGPAHSTKIWRNRDLSKIAKRDQEKTGLLLSKGMCVIRIQHVKALTKKRKRDILSKLLDILKEIELKFPPQGKRQFRIGED